MKQLGTVTLKTLHFHGNSEPACSAVGSCMCMFKATVQKLPKVFIQNTGTSTKTKVDHPVHHQARVSVTV